MRPPERVGRRAQIGHRRNDRVELLAQTRASARRSGASRRRGVDAQHRHLTRIENVRRERPSPSRPAASRCASRDSSPVEAPRDASSPARSRSSRLPPTPGSADARAKAQTREERDAIADHLQIETVAPIDVLVADESAHRAALRAIEAVRRRKHRIDARLAATTSRSTPEARSSPARSAGRSSVARTSASGTSKWLANTRARPARPCTSDNESSH